MMPKYTLKQARNLADMTLAQVGEAVGKAPQTVSLWENGSSSISAADFVELCKMYNVSTDQIILPKKSS